MNRFCGKCRSTRQGASGLGSLAAEPGRIPGNESGGAKSEIENLKSRSRGRDEMEKAGGGAGGVQEKSLIEGPTCLHLGLRMLDCGD